MKYVAALLLALAMLVVPGLAFVPNIPIGALENINSSMTADYGSYTFQRFAVDAGETDTTPFSPQDAYSGMIFGAGAGKPGQVVIGVDTVNNTAIFGDSNHAGFANNFAYTGGILANKISTNASYYYTDPLGGVTNTNVGVDTTRQYIQQGGNMYVTFVPEGSDSEVPTGYSQMGLSKTNLAWISSKVDEFTVDPQSYGVVGGNFIDAVPLELSPYCKNIWLWEQEREAPITIRTEGDGNVDLIEAYAGTASNVNLKLFPESAKNDDAKTLMSGYAERFAGYDNAEVAGNLPVVGQNFTLWNDNKVVMDFGSDGQENVVENYWTTSEGVLWNEPFCEDFPNIVSGDFKGMATWPGIPYIPGNST
jgi:hypothetical protein